MAKYSYEFLQKLPKAELHCHLDGSVKPETVMELAQEQGVDLGVKDLEELKQKLYVPIDCPSLVVYLQAFDIVNLVLQKSYALTRVVIELIEEAKKDGIQHIEIRFAPLFHMHEGLSLSAVVEAVIEGAIAGERKYGVSTRIICCAIRHMSGDDSEACAQIAWRYRNRGVVAFDLAGPENGFPSHKHARAFDLIRREGLNCTVHAGEAAGAASIRDAIQYCGAQRIGHGVALREDSDLFNFVRDRQIALEMCPTSNIQTKAINTLEDHPILDYLSKGINCVICTDNRTMSNVTLTHEYKLVTDTFDITPAQLLRLVYNGFISAFLSPSRRSRIIAEAMHLAITLFVNEGFDLSDLSSQFYNNTDFPENYTVGQGIPYWKPVSHPKLTLDMIKAMPKLDTHIRFDRSVSLETIWKNIQRLSEHEQKKRLGRQVASFEELTHIIKPGQWQNEEALIHAKQVITGSLMDIEAITEGVEDIVRRCAADNVIYAEIQFAPAAHAKRGLSIASATEAIFTAIQGRSDRSVEINLVLACSTKNDDPVVWYEVAQLCSKYRCAFAVMGGDLTESQAAYFNRTFSYLKEHSIPSSISCGRKNIESITHALTTAQASRLSSCYVMHTAPSTVDYVARHRIPIELSETQQMLSTTENVLSFAPTIVRLYLDQHVKITVCSISSTFTGHSLSETLYNIATKCNCDAADLMSLLMTSCRSAFVDHERRELYAKQVWDTVESQLKAQGFVFMKKRAYLTE